MWDFILIGTVTLGFLIYVYLTWNFNHWKKRGVDGPKPFPLVGNVPSLVTGKRNFVYDYDDIYRKFKLKEKFVGVFEFRAPRLLIIDPNLVKEVLVTSFKSFHDNTFAAFLNSDVDKLLSQNPFILTGQEWKDRRSEITPALTATRIKAVYPVMLEVCKSLNKFIERENKLQTKDGLEARDLTSRYTVEVVSNCIYGIDANGFSSSDDCEIRKKAKEIFNVDFISMMRVIILTAMPFLRKIYKRPMVDTKVETFFTDIMKSAVKARQNSKIDRADFLAYLLQLKEKKNLSDLDMAAHTLTFFLDGFETSSHVIAHVLHMLGRHIDVQEKLREEIENASKDNLIISFEQLHDLPYLEQVFNETLRLFPPGMTLSKMCTEDFTMEKNTGEKVLIEKGIGVILPVLSIHRDEQYYPNPEEFDPDRFSLENGGTKRFKDRGVYMPFGDGPRICLGMKFALTQSKIAIVEIIRNWGISMNPKTKKDIVIDKKELICAVEGGIWLNFTKL